MPNPHIGRRDPQAVIDKLEEENRLLNVESRIDTDEIPMKYQEWNQTVMALVKELEQVMKENNG